MEENYVPPNSKLRVYGFPLHAYSAEACGRQVVSEHNRVYALISSFQHTIVGAFLTLNLHTPHKNEHQSQIPGMPILCHTLQWSLKSTYLMDQNGPVFLHSQS